MNINAVNYDPSATVDDFSCTYELRPSGGSKHFFSDVQGLRETSFTMSYSVEGNSWVFFHDYVPDFYFHTRNQLWTLKDQRIYKHNSGPHGMYYKEFPNSFFVDVVFKSDSELLLETVNWITEVFKYNTQKEWETITHMTIWNSQQHTGRIPLKNLTGYATTGNTRKTKGEWSFNDFRNILTDRGSAFLLDIFGDFALLPGAGGGKGWYDTELMEDKYFVVRFEHDNSGDREIVLHQTNIQALKSNR